jgi:hypothetical protein
MDRIRSPRWHTYLTEGVIPGLAKSQPSLAENRMAGFECIGHVGHDVLFRAVFVLAPRLSNGKGAPMPRIDPVKTGLAFALFLGGWHALWSALVAAGLAQWLIDFVFWIHFMKPVFMIEAFDGLRAVILIGVTAAVGFAFGWIFAVLWNRVHG